MDIRAINDYIIDKKLGYITLKGTSNSDYIAAHYTIINNDPNDDDMYDMLRYDMYVYIRSWSVSICGVLP